MTPHAATSAALLAVALLSGGTRLPGMSPAPIRVETSRMAMGCLYTIVAHGDQESAIRAVLETALDEVDRLDRLMSHYKADSALSAINRDAARGPVTVDPELLDLVAAALEHSAASDGAFDITVGPLMQAWGFFRGDGRLPDPAALAVARAAVGYQHVTVDRERRTIRFARPGMSLDLGGIGKGYAVDRVVALLRARGVTAALVSAGGSSVYGLGSPPDAPGWAIDVQDPRDASRIAFAVTLRNRALSIAGGSEKHFEANGVRYSHIMDPRSGRPIDADATVLVLSDGATTGDMLDNALLVLGRKAGRALLGRHPGVEALTGVGSRFSPF